MKRTDTTLSPYEMGINTADHLISRCGKGKPNQLGHIHVAIADCWYTRESLEWRAWHCGFAYRLSRRNEKARHRLLVHIGPPSETEPDPAGIAPPGPVKRSWCGDLRSGNVGVFVNMSGESELRALVYYNVPKKMRLAKPEHDAGDICLRLTKGEAISLARAIMATAEGML